MASEYLVPGLCVVLAPDSVAEGGIMSLELHDGLMLVLKVITATVHFKGINFWVVRLVVFVSIGRDLQFLSPVSCDAIFVHRNLLFV